MGLVNSKPDPYVLKVDESKPKYSSVAKPLPPTRANSMVPVNNKVVASHSSKEHEHSSGQENYNYGMHGKSPSSHKLAHAPSSSKIIKQSSLLPTPENGPIAVNMQRRMSAQRSELNLGGNNMLNTHGSGSSPSGKLKCSDSYAWLIKSGNFTGMALAEVEMGRVIGLMGTVRVCRLKTGQFFVLKSVRKDYIAKHNDYPHVNNERDILRNLRHPFCIKLVGTFQDRLHIYFALEYAPGGELFHRLGKKKAFSPQVAKFYATEVCSALEYVQSLGVVYRDLKPENVLLDEEGHCKLVDFGFAIPLQHPEQRMKTLCGTPAYLSPEQLDGKLTAGYTKVVDWWSYGVLIYELLTGKTPFCRSHHESHYEIFLRIISQKISFPRSFDSSSKALVAALCHAKLEKRLCEGSEVKAHVYFEIPWEAVQERRLVPPFVPRLKEEGDVHYFDKYPDPLLPSSLTSDGSNGGAAGGGATIEGGTAAAMALAASAGRGSVGSEYLDF